MTIIVTLMMTIVYQLISLPFNERYRKPCSVSMNSSHPCLPFPPTLQVTTISPMVNQPNQWTILWWCLKQPHVLWLLAPPYNPLPLETILLPTHCSMLHPHLSPAPTHLIQLTPLWLSTQQFTPMATTPYQQPTGHKNTRMPIAQHQPFPALSTPSMDFPWLPIDYALLEHMDHPPDGPYNPHVFKPPFAFNQTNPQPHPIILSCWPLELTHHQLAVTIPTHKTNPQFCCLHDRTLAILHCTLPYWQAQLETTLAYCQLIIYKSENTLE